ncbi:MAG: hypothetical protein M3Z50_13755 [Actinomycetota bacterium]|nr:hypothetical protein [Actinomycetota bacterium]
MNATHVIAHPIRLAAAGAAVLLAAGCGSNSSQPTGSVAQAGSGPGIHVAKTSLGNVLVTGSGRTLYLLTADSPGKSTCNASCLQYWRAVAPPAKGTKPTGVSGKVARTTTPGGSAILTVGGWPMYTYAQDQVSGDIHGQGVKSFGGVWYAVSPTGSPVKAAASNPSSPGSPSGSGSSGGSGGGY